MKIAALVAGMSGNNSNWIALHSLTEVRKYSFHETYSHVEKVKEFLLHCGVRPGMRIGIIGENCYEWILLDLGVLDFGCRLVALPESFASQGPRDLADQFALSLLFTGRIAGTDIPEAEWICRLQSLRGEFAGGKRVRMPGFPEDEGELTLHFSSGSTGTLKCLVAGRLGTEAFIQGYWDIFPWLNSDTMLAFMPLSSYQQRLLLYSAIGYSHNVVFTSPGELMAAFIDTGATVFVGPPVFFERLEKRLTDPKRKADPLEGLRQIAPHIRFFLTGMAPIRTSAVNFFSSIGVPLYPVYSLNESGTVSANTPASLRPGTVGRLFPQTAITIAEDGEILVRKPHFLSTRYLNPPATDETFLPDGAIATGDLGWLDEDGFLSIIGRKKNVIITSSGAKLNPEVIESKLEAWPEVNRVVVFGSEEPYLCAVVQYAAPKDKAVEMRIWEKCQALNKELGIASFIGAIAFTTTEFTVENGFLTRNLKLDRNHIYLAFQDQFTVPARDHA